MGHILFYNLHLFFSVFLGLKILLGCGLNMIIQMSVVLKNIVIRDSDLTTRAYSVCFPERIKSHIRPLVVLSKFLSCFNVWQEWATSIFLNIYTSSRVSFWAFTFTGQRQILPGENNSEYFNYLGNKSSHAPGDSTPSSQKAGRFEEKKLLAVSKSEGILWKLKGCKFMKC